MAEPDEPEPVVAYLAVAVNPGWWVIAGDVFLEALKRAADGESPDLLYAEYYANTERVDPNEGETK